MTNREFIQTSEQIRDLCDDMSARQIKDLIQLLEYDMEEK